MKSDKIYVEKPAADDNSNKKEGKKQQPDKKEPITISPNPRANENITNTPDANKPKKSTGVGSEITDGEDG
jgi:hypothetical protein